MNPTRTPRGTFAAGNPGGPGRPPRQTERDYLAVIATACPLETWATIVQRAVEDAKAGDASARTWLASYLTGRPGHASPSLHRLAVEDLADSDPVAIDAHGERLRALMAGV